MSLKFTSKFKKEMERSGIDVSEAEPPRYWISTGNYVLNKTISGSFLRGYPQGRVVCLSGSAGTGKSFLVCNAMREAQKQGIFVVTGDSEHALDENFVKKIGVDTSDECWLYAELDTISQTQKFVSSFLKSYQTDYGVGDPNAPKVLLVIDSLDMLQSDSEEENFQKGELKGDMGQRSKQLKSMLRSFVHGIKRQNITILVTHQVYKNQDIRNGEGVWIVNDAIKYSLSQITLLTKLKLKDADGVNGVKIKAEGYKTRFTKPFQVASLEVPYETGLDPYDGLLDAAVSLGYIEQRGAWYYYGEKSFQRKNFLDIAPEILEKCEADNTSYMNVEILPEDEDHSVGKSALKKRSEQVLLEE